MKRLLGLGLHISLIGLLLVSCTPATPASQPKVEPSVTAKSPDLASISFSLNNTSIQLTNGRFERQAAPGSASKEVVALTETKASGDLNGDGVTDASVVIS